MIIRRERPHPGAQLKFTDADGHRFQATLTDLVGDMVEIERLHRGRGDAENLIRGAKQTGLENLPFREPKALRYRLLHTAGRLSFHARRAVLRLPANWPWASALAAAFARLRELASPAG